MIYPYAPYFFNMFREIPWNEWKYEDDELVARCNSKTPYVIMGGSACELLDRVYGAQLPEQVRLHTHTDPTGDIDVKMPGIVIESKKKLKGKKRPREYTYFSDHKGTMYRYTRSYTFWLLDQIEAYFKKLSYNFKEWFPTATDFVYEADEEAALAEMSSARSVGPFQIYLIIYKKSAGEKASMRIQVSMAHRYEGQVKQDHFIELLLDWGDPTRYDVPEKHVFLDTFGLIVCTPESELNRNSDGIENRIHLVNDTLRVHKIKNHFGRAIFLINLLNLPHFYNALGEDIRRQIMYIYRNSITWTAKNDDAIEYAIQLLKNCPKRFKESDIVIYTTYRQLCEYKFHMTLAECGLSTDGPKSGGRRITRRRSRSRRD